MGYAVFAFLACVVVWAAICALIGLPVMILWNITMPEIFHLPEITWVQGFCLYALIFILRSGTFSVPDRARKE